jgi:hypothetical protein
MTVMRRNWVALSDELVRLQCATRADLGTQARPDDLNHPLSLP